MNERTLMSLGRHMVEFSRSLGTDLVRWWSESFSFLIPIYLVCILCGDEQSTQCTGIIVVNKAKGGRTHIGIYNITFAP